MNESRFVILGGGMVAGNAAKQLVELGGAAKFVKDYAAAGLKDKVPLYGSGFLTEVQYPDGSNKQYQVDPTITNELGQVTTFSYDGSGALTKRTSTPSLPSNTAIAPSRTRRDRSTSTVKSTWPGVSIRLML